MWRIAPGDILDEQTVKSRIREIELLSQWPRTPAGRLAAAAFHARTCALRLVTPALRLLRLEPAVAMRATSDLPDVTQSPPLATDSAATILDRTLDLPPRDLVEICWRYLSVDRGRALRDNGPDLDTLTDAASARERFNRQVPAMSRAMCSRMRSRARAFRTSRRRISSLANYNWRVIVPLASIQ